MLCQRFCIDYGTIGAVGIIIIYKAAAHNVSCIETSAEHNVPYLNMQFYISLITIIYCTIVDIH